MSYSILFVCMGNICRSPSAEGIFRAKVEAAGLQNVIQIDSAGTIGYHTGDLPDARMRKAASARGYTLSSRARQVTAADMTTFDEVIAMDFDNLAYLETLHKDSSGTAKLSLMCDYAHHHSAKEVPDPYYGGAKGFEIVMDLLEDASSGLLESVQKQLAAD